MVCFDDFVRAFAAPGIKRVFDFHVDVGDVDYAARGNRDTLFFHAPAVDQCFTFADDQLGAAFRDVDAKDAGLCEEHFTGRRYNSDQFEALLERFEEV